MDYDDCKEYSELSDCEVCIDMNCPYNLNPGGEW